MLKTIFIAQECPANALALNKDYNKVVIAGRNVFKIFSIEEEEFVEVCNLRVGKNLNLNFSCNDVAWNNIDDHILATAATNGAVVVWNLNRASRSKQEHVFVDHKRTVNKVCFNPVEANWLISGSQDGTMKTFDLRTKEVIKTFFSNTESVRDVQFSPHSHFTFASVSENGNVQLWDMRKTEKCVLQFTAHSGPIFACDWHSEKPCLATASRDKTIKVWDLSGRPLLEHTISTIASVGRIKWRPQSTFHIASVALVVDCTVNVWDVRRPYIPYAAFTKHKDVATGIAWRGSPDVLLTTSRDCTLYQHTFKDAVYPALHSNQKALDISPSGEIAFAFRINAGQSRQNKLAGTSRKPGNEEFWQASSALNVIRRVLNKELDWLLKCAEQYVLAGKPLADICDHNADVARRLGRLAVSLLWTTVKTLYTPRTSDHGHQTPSKEEQVDGEVEGERDNEIRREDDDDLGTRLGDSVGDFFFGDAEMDPLSMDFEINGLDGLISQDWGIPMEAFPLRHEILDRSPPPEQYTAPDSPDSADGEMQGLNLENSLSLKAIGSCKPMSWEAGVTLADALRSHAEQGDVQTPVCILIALGEKRSNLISHIEPVEQETWTFAYLDILSQQRMWLHSNQIIKLSWLPSVSQLNQQSTTVYTGCSYCNKPLTQAGWMCSKCDQSVVCSLCHQVVHGLYAWCQGCMHGGHLTHMKEWIEKKKFCPTGCGHACQYN
ncbi:unnamed protein product [Nezara viridula]|uniref:GATOR2 complex protein WDR24 n=1 Tax=Nezara viridula TaxID=85310 RepID=A0A9P0H6L7_NEZVI|nr:unnamed protein product [Nezara viridula]